MAKIVAGKDGWDGVTAAHTPCMAETALIEIEAVMYGSSVSVGRK